jgi:acyl-CoA dehydrogenase
MAWDFETEPEFEAKLAWMREFVREEVLPLETLADVWRAPGGSAQYARVTDPLKEEVRGKGLWAAHLPPELGGHGFGQVKLGLMHEILGRSELAPAIFGNNAPESGNAELLAIGGTEEQKQRWMFPILEGKLRSGYSMTEPGAGADPTMLSTEAVRDGDEWVINGHKWFTSNASVADFLIVMCRTNQDPDAEPRKSYSMIVVPTDTPGLDVNRDIPCMSAPEPTPGMPGNHCEVLYRDVRVPFDHVIGGEAGVGQGFALAQRRLGPGRIHHAMRWLGQCQRAFDAMCERAVSRETAGSLLADKQMVQDMVAESWAEMQAARLVTLQAAWKMDKLVAAGGHNSDARLEIGVIKFWGARVLHNVIDRSIQVHGSLGYSGDMPLESMYRRARAARILDGPDEVHKVNVARYLLKTYRPAGTPSEHVPTRRAAAIEKLAAIIDLEAVNS